MILYIIQAHHLPAQVAALVELLDAPDSGFIVNIDPAAGADFSAVAEKLARIGAARAILRRGLPPTWSGMSQVYTLLDSLRFALSWRQDWRYVVNLSGACIPLKSQNAIRRYLDDAAASGKQVHLSFFGPTTRPNVFYDKPYGVVDLGDFQPVEINFVDRVKALVEPSLRQLLNDRTESPLFDWTRRGAMHVADMALIKKVVIRRLFPFEVERRRRFFERQPLSGGRAWYMMTRAAAEAVVSNELLPELTGMFEHFFCPDELFLQTLVTNSARFRPEAIVRRNAHFKQGEPNRIDDSNADDVLASDALFARKIVYDTAPRLLAAIRDRIAG